MRSYEETIRDWNDGKEWFDVPDQLKHELAAQYLRDEGFLVAIAGTNDKKFEHIFGDLLADMIEARHMSTDHFTEAARKFATAAYAFMVSELDDTLAEEWQLGAPDSPDVDGPAEAQARHRDFVGMARS